MLCVVCWLLVVVLCSLCVVYCCCIVLVDVCCLMFGCLLFAACRLLGVVDCWSLVAGFWLLVAVC